MQTWMERKAMQQRLAEVKVGITRRRVPGRKITSEHFLSLII